VLSKFKLNFPESPTTSERLKAETSLLTERKGGEDIWEPWLPLLWYLSLTRNDFGSPMSLVRIHHLIYSPTMNVCKRTITQLLIGLILVCANLQLQANENQILAEGEQLFRVHCARCHGVEGEGGEGANLKRKKLKHAADEAALLMVINFGIPGTGMPGNIFDENQAKQIAAYVRFIGKIETGPPPGDSERGAELFARQGGCLTCHIVAGKGRAFGPELTSIGDQRGLAYLREALITPASRMPGNSVPLSGSYQGYLSVQLKTGSGSIVRGVRVNEDAFSIQIRDVDGRLRSFTKQTLVEFEKLFGHSLMPSTVLSTNDLDDLVSYLMSLRE
jgi:cytochrome c oxidase cbb3-type subunit III